MEKEGEREGMEQTETSSERGTKDEWRENEEEELKKKEGAGLRTEQEREKLKGANPQGL